MGKAQRDKGIRGELEVVRAFTGAGLEAYRSAGLQAGSVAGAGDVTVRDYLGLHVEVKRCEGLRLGAWIAQAEEAVTETGQRPVICYRRSGERWRATVDLDYLVGLLADSRELARVIEG